MQEKECPFGTFCSFDHNRGDIQKKSVKNDKTTIEELKNLLNSKNEEIVNLTKTIEAMTEVINLNEEGFDEESDHESDGESDLADEIESEYVDDVIFKCDKCTFTTKKKMV